MTVLAVLLWLASSAPAAVAPEFEALYERMSRTLQAKTASTGEVSLGPTDSVRVGSLWGAPEVTARFDGLLSGTAFTPARLVVNERAEQELPEEGTPYGATHRVERDVTYTASADGVLQEVLRLEGGLWDGERTVRAARDVEPEGRALAARAVAALRMRNLDALIRKAKAGDVDGYEKSEGGLSVNITVKLEDSETGRTKVLRVEEERKREDGDEYDSEKNYSSDTETLVVHYTMQGRPERLTRRVTRSKRVVVKGAPTQQEKARFRLLLSEILLRL